MADYRLNLYQTLTEEDAMPVALRESLQIYNNDKENRDLELAIRLSLAESREEPSSLEQEDKENCARPGEGPVQHAQRRTIDSWLYEQTLTPEQFERWLKLVTTPARQEPKLEYSVNIEEEDSDDECQDENRDVPKPELPTSQENPNIDIWKESQEMSETYTPAEKSPAREEEMQTRHEPVYQDLATRDDIVTLPDLGTFKVKKDFSSLASNQLLTKMLSQVNAEPQQPRVTPPTSVLGHGNNIPESTFLFSPKAGPSQSKSTDESCKRRLTEEERRSASYNSLVQAQRIYAEKLIRPEGSDGRLTEDQFNLMLEKLTADEWNAGFAQDDEISWQVKKENNPEGFTGKGKERAIELDETDEEEEAPSLTMSFCEQRG